MKCKPYSEITVEIRTQLKTVKITSNIFAVHVIAVLEHAFALLEYSYAVLEQGGVTNRDFI